MGTVLSIANKLADDLSFDSVATLYGTVEDGDTTTRRLRRAIERTCKFLNGALDWQEIRREHSFLTLAQEIQTGAVPHDFSRFVPGTMYDRSRRIHLVQAESAQDWSAFKAYPALSSWVPRWTRQGNDILIAPTYQAGITIAYEYFSNAVTKTRESSMEVLYTTPGMTLAVNKRYIVRPGHSITFPHMGPAEAIEIVPEGGLWVNLGATFTMADGLPMQNDCPTGYSDWITVSRTAGTYHFSPNFGAWLRIAEPTVNGMTLEVNKRYLVGQGHRLELPIMAKNEQIELVSVTGAWLSNNSKITTRGTLEIAPTMPVSGLVTITGDMANVDQPYTISNGISNTNDIWNKVRYKSEFSADTDEPLWPDELVILGAIWNIQYRDGNQYNEDFRAFERAMYDAFKGSQGTGSISMCGGEDKWKIKPFRPGLYIQQVP